MHFRGSPIWSKLYSYIKSSRSVCPYVNLKTAYRISDIDCGCLIYPIWIRILKAVVRRCSVKKFLLEIRQNSQENNRVRISGTAFNFIKKETLAQVFSCEFCLIFKNINYLWWLLLVFIFYDGFFFVCFFPIVIYCYYNDWPLLRKSYFNATKLSKVINN